MLRVGSTKSKQLANAALNVALVLAVFILVASYRLPVMGHDLYSPATSCELGYIRGGSVVSHRFSIINVHPWPVNIVSVQTSCGCTRGLSSRAIPTTLRPLQSVDLTVTINTRGKGKGGMTEQAVVYTDDNAQGNVYTLHGTVI